MKKLLFILFSLVSISVYAINDVEMVEYDQGFMDDAAAISLKNNTDKDVKKVSFRLTYIDMKGKELDYMEFSEKVDIAPGMTKTIYIEPFAHDRQFSYYKSDSFYPDPHSFKVKYELLGYNNAPEATPKSVSAKSGVGKDSGVEAEGNSFLDFFDRNNDSLILLFIFAFYLGSYYLTATLAREYNRSAAAWVFVSLFLTPFVTCIVLLLFGKRRDSDV